MSTEVRTAKEGEKRREALADAHFDTCASDAPTNNARPVVESISKPDSPADEAREAVAEASRQLDAAQALLEDQIVSVKWQEIDVQRCRMAYERACRQLLAAEGKSLEEWAVRTDGAGVRVVERPKEDVKP